MLQLATQYLIKVTYILAFFIEFFLLNFPGGGAGSREVYMGRLEYTKPNNSVTLGWNWEKML